MPFLFGVAFFVFIFPADYAEERRSYLLEFTIVRQNLY